MRTTALLIWFSLFGMAEYGSTPIANALLTALCIGVFHEYRTKGQCRSPYDALTKASAIIWVGAYDAIESSSALTGSANA